MKYEMHTCGASRMQMPSGRCAQMPSCCYTVADATWGHAQMHPIAHHNEQSLYVALPSVYPARSVPHPRASLVAAMIQTRFTSHNLIVLQLEFTSLDVLTDATWLTIMSKGERPFAIAFLSHTCLVFKHTFRPSSVGKPLRGHC